MGRHRSNVLEESSSSSDDEDAFSALSRKSNKRPKPTPSSDKSENPGTAANEDHSDCPVESSASHSLGSSALTSSMKRHHSALTDSRKAKMDALLVELQDSKPQAAARPQSSRVRGSFVQPGEEGVTTNLFVGNLAPSITEEQLTDLFSQFGDLYSVKIMWARTAEERSRNRHSGFVCFMNRQDAEDAITECDETDPFNVGRLIMVRWGRHVKKDRGPMVKRQPTRSNTEVAQEIRQKLPKTTASGNLPLIHVVPPADARRVHFISTVASFVAKDGSQLEDRLRQQEALNPQFSFLRVPTNDQEYQEQVYYRWRVFSFLQGDGYHAWRTDPFVMLEPGGCQWLPPPVDEEAARREQREEERKVAEIRRQKEQRRLQYTGRQLEHKRKSGGRADGKLTREEMADFDLLCRKELCASRGSICRAMAFCFEKSACSDQICALLRGLLLDEKDPKREFQVETKIAQLFLLSDILFNSQQPGVRNAFRFRDAIEKMGPEIFASLGSQSRHLGRWTRNKLSTAVSAVLGAWTNWSVYNPTFLDELHAKYEGREVTKIVIPVEAPQVQESVPKEEEQMPEKAEEIVQKTPKGDWTVVDNEHDESTVDGVHNSKADDNGGSSPDGEPLEEEDADGEPLEEEAGTDGEPMEDDVDGESIGAEEDEACLEDADGEPLDEDVDGQALDADGDPIEENVL